MTNKFFLLFLTLLPLTSFAQSQVVKVLGSKTRFTVQKIHGLSTGKKILVSDKEREYQTLEAGILECKLRTCLSEIISNPQNIQISAGSKVTLKREKRYWSAAVSVENALGLTPGAAVYYSFPRSPWTVGLKYRNVSTTISSIKLSGNFISLEGQRYIWSKSRFQIWGAAELGMINVQMDLSKFSSTEPKINKSERFLAVGVEGRYNLTENLRLLAGVRDRKSVV